MGRNVPPDGRTPSPEHRRGREKGSSVRRCVPEYITIATVLAPHGIHGELKVRIETDFPERFQLLHRVYLGAELLPYDFEGFRAHQRSGLLKLRGCDDRSAAEKLCGMDVQIPISEAMPLRPGQHYVHELLGLGVQAEDGEPLGLLEEVLFTGSNAVYVVRGATGEVLIPVLKGVVLSVDLDKGRIVVRLPPGLLD